MSTKNAEHIRAGVDIGGTFTDVVLEKGSELFSTKLLTTYAAPENAIIEGLLKVCAVAGVEPSQLEQIIHGTTLATNALIERRGAKTALITTSGFRDVIEMRTESRFEQYDLNLILPEPLLPRQARFTVPERVAADGSILVHLDQHAVEQVIEQIKTAGYESIAVGLIHAYANPAHERAVKDAIQSALPDTMVSLSSEVSPQMREYERFNTVIANAYIKPLMKSYLDRLEGRLGEVGVSCPVYLMHSGGGIISLANAAEFPVRLVESGPAGGAVFAADIAARYQLDKVLSFDMGGTTAKICLIKNQLPSTSRVFEVARTYRFKKGSGMPISIPVIDMVEIGAGGGSLASVDALRQIRVGPQSAGSEPGPACYNRGGEQPAVTDADLLLGKLDPDNFAGGSITLSVPTAEQAMLEYVAEPLDMDTQTAAYGVAEVVDENMANAARVHAVENGEDLSGYTMIAFGGAAPLHAVRLCQKLGVQRLLIPPGAGVGSAIGFLRAPFSYEAVRSAYMTLHKFDDSLARTLFGELESDATDFVRSCVPDAELQSSYKLYMRYTGQGWEIPVPLSPGQAQQPDSVVLQRLFEHEYEALFARTVDGMSIEITGWSVNVSTSTESVTVVKDIEKRETVESLKLRSLHDPGEDRQLDARVMERAALKEGSELAGPAVVTERETSIILAKGAVAVMRADGCIDVEVHGATST